MNISQEGLSLIKKFEGCELEAYKCAAGVLTIGYGSY
jgi:lysozyme